MSAPDPADAHATLGRQFRTPAHPDVVSALGRALFCFLYLEETVTAILYDAGAESLPMTRAKMAGAKEKALKELANAYRANPGSNDIADALDAAAIAFGRARRSVRNELLHAHPFTAGQDSEGGYLPGLAYTAQDGKSWKTVSQTPEDLLDLATEMEKALGPMNAARVLVQGSPLASP